LLIPPISKDWKIAQINLQNEIEYTQSHSNKLMVVHLIVVLYLKLFLVFVEYIVKKGTTI